MTKRYRKKIEYVEAVQWTGDNTAEVEQYLHRIDPNALVKHYGRYLYIKFKSGQREDIDVKMSHFIVYKQDGILYDYPAHVFLREFEGMKEKE